MGAYRGEMERLAERLWGQPNRALSTRKQLRFGTNGSKKLCLIDDVWYDFEAGKGGGFRDLFKLANGRWPAPHESPNRQFHTATSTYRYGGVSEHR